MKVLFICLANIFRSQIAEAYFNRFTKKNKAESAALRQKRNTMHALVIRAMKEEEISIENNSSDQVTQGLVQNADVIILMSQDLKEIFNNMNFQIKPATKIQVWNIKDVHAKDTDEHFYPNIIKARNQIKQRVINLIKQLGQ